MKDNKKNETLKKASNINQQKDLFLKKADRVLSVINNINRQGGITTQLQMAAACLELQYYDLYLLNTYNEKSIDRNDFPDLPKLEEYIRLFNNVEQDFWNDLDGKDRLLQRKEDIETISYMQDFIAQDDIRGVYYSDYECLNSWKELKTDIDLLTCLFNYLIRIVVSEFESIYQVVRKSKYGTPINLTYQERRIRNNFREYVIDNKRTEEIVEKLHRLIENKSNTEGIKIINEAMWIGLLKRPTAPSIKEEFQSINCADTYINRILDENKPKKGLMVDEESLDRIRKKFEQA